MERLGNQRPSGLDAGKLRAWAMLFAVAGIIGRGLLQSKLLGVGTLSAEQLLAVMQSSESAMATATVSLVLQAMETVAVPIFVFLLMQGFQNTSDLKMYLLRVLGLAVVAEIPYNLAMSQQLFDMGSRNPVFGLVLGLILMYLYTRFDGKMLLSTIMFLAGVAWALMLRVDHGIPALIMLTVMWALRKRSALMCFSGAAAAVMCVAISPFYLAAPMAFLVIHFYNGEEGGTSRVVNYVFYPAALLILGLVAMFAM